MNILSREKQTSVISLLVEGNSIRSIERITKIHRDTICRLLVRAGSGRRNKAGALFYPDGDGGRSIGPFQIQRGYWADARVAGRYEDCRRADYARGVMVAYWRRYCPAAMADGDVQTLARVHNGGPAGSRRKTTIGYWMKVKKVMG